MPQILIKHGIEWLSKLVSLIKEIDLGMRSLALDHIVITISEVVNLMMQDEVNTCPSMREPRMHPY
jgi:hypothetical protein